jgi:pimeloyl-ACP methyl ester carboxylesterase
MSIVRTVEGKAGPIDIRFRPAAATKRADILFVHGAWSSAWYWEPYFLPWFAQMGYDCASLALRGHGNSAGRLRWASISDYVADVRAVAETMNDPFIVGHSMGGFIAQHYARAYPARGVALMASVPPGGAWSATFKVLRERPLILLKCLLRLDLLPVVEDRDYARKLLFSRDPSRTDKDHYLKNVRSESFRAFLDMLLRPVRGKVSGDVPFAVFGAEDDQIVTPRDVHKTAAAHGVEAQILPRTSHMLTVDDRWQDAAAALEGWLAGCLARSPQLKATGHGR